MKEIKPIQELTSEELESVIGGTDSNVKVGGLVCNKKAPVLQSVKVGGLVCNKKAPDVSTL